MTHESYNNSKNKIRKNFEKSKQNESDLNDKRNQLLNFFTDRGKIAVSKTLYDSGFLAEAPQSDASIVRAKPNELLSEFVTLDHEANIDIPEDLLPFVDVNLSIKTVPNVSATGYLEHPISVVGDEEVTVKGDGNLIYQGPIPRALKTVYSQSELDDGQFQENYTKKVFNGEIIYTFGGDTFKITGLVYQIQFNDNLGTFGPGCITGTMNNDIYRTNIDQFLGDFKNYANFNSLTSTNVNMDHLKIENRANPFPDCFGNTVTEIDDLNATFTFADFTSGGDSYTISLQNGALFKEIDGQFVQQASGNFDFLSSIHTLVSQTFTFQGYWLFYSEDTYFFFGIDEVAPPEMEGNFDKMELKNLPQSPNRPWTSITLERNPEGFPTTENVDIIKIGSRQQHYFKLIDDLGDGLSRFRLTLSETLVLSSKSSNNPSETASLQAPVYDDIYTQVGSTYELTTENHTLKDLFFYEASNQDVQFRLQLELKNPFYWEEIRNTT